MFKIALCQAGTGLKDRQANRDKIAAFIGEAAKNGAQMVCLPEMWNCPYANEYFREYAETAEGEAVKLMSGLAKELGIYIIGGSIAELEGDKVYNTSFCFDKKGDIIGRHRKVHLFDIDVPGKVRFMESDTLTAGSDMTVFETEFCKVGVGICYDVRFPEWFMKMAKAGAELIFLPAAFSVTTGEAHWETIMKARAMDNQVYFAANGPARDENGVYVAYGNSMVVGPWAEIITKADEKECIIYADIDIEHLKEVRQQLPLLKQRRTDIY